MPERRPRAPAGGRAPGSPLRLPGRAGQAEASISLRQAALYFLALLAGMFVALLMDSGGNTSALRPGAAKNSHLYKVLAPSPASAAPPAIVHLGDAPKAAPAATQPRAAGGGGALADAQAVVERSEKQESSMATIVNTQPSRLWQSPREVARCEDTCPDAKNGKCNDGRGKVDFETVSCDLGTDCSDCGEWRGRVTESLVPAATAGRMIADLKAESSEVLIRATTCPPTFLFAFTNPKYDVDVSSHVHNSGCLERDLTFVWYKLLAERCAKSPEIVVDVGGNFGWYTIYAAKMGCRVVTWEPVPRFRAYLLYNVLINNLGHLVEVRDSVVTNEGVTQTVIVPQRGIWGTAGIGGMNIDRAIDNEGAYMRVESASERVDEVVAGHPVALMKVDVEGFEPTVLASAQQLLASGTLDHIFLEYSPGVGHRAHNWTMTLGFPLMLRDISSAGYNIRSFETPGLERPPYEHWDTASLLPLEMVTPGNLKYDVRDWEETVRTGVFGCKAKPEAVKRMASPMYHACRIALPEGLHPMSFHSVFSHNTNIWAARQALDNFPSGPVTGTMKPSDDFRSYFSTRDSAEGMLGMGGRVCKHLPPEVQVFHRCRCLKPDVCGEEEALITQYYAEAPADIND
eukprot:jgi/Tetstr1/462769/TSEL_007721.t1